MTRAHAPLRGPGEGYGVGDIGKLFIAGFGASLLFGTVVGSLADKYGRKKAALLYCATYICSCITKHSPSYPVLMLGRFFGGIATSLLFSAFEAWVVAEHGKRNFPAEWLGGTFSKAVFFGNGLVAILSGLVANTLVYTAQQGPVAPFDAAIVVLAIGAAIIYYKWAENFGDVSEQNIAEQYKVAIGAIRSDRRVLLLGAIQSCFEGAMYTFVFLWTPALSPNDEDIPHGFIFAVMMACSMVGSALANKLMATQGRRVEAYMRTVMGVAALCLFVPVVTSSDGGKPGGNLPIGGKIKLMAFLCFEVRVDWPWRPCLVCPCACARFVCHPLYLTKGSIDTSRARGAQHTHARARTHAHALVQCCVGIFWPSLMTLRSKYVPEDVRSTIINLFRVPLNLFVCVVLYNASIFPIAGMFMLTVVMMLVSWYCMTALEKITRTAADAQPENTTPSKGASRL